MTLFFFLLVFILFCFLFTFFFYILVLPDQKLATIKTLPVATLPPTLPPILPTPLPPQMCTPPLTHQRMPIKTSPTDDDLSHLCYTNRCPNCGRNYKHKFTLTRHLKYECGRSAGMKCSLCKYQSKYQSNVNKHYRTVHLKLS